MAEEEGRSQGVAGCDAGSLPDHLGWAGDLQWSPLRYLPDPAESKFSSALDGAGHLDAHHREDLGGPRSQPAGAWGSARDARHFVWRRDSGETLSRRSVFYATRGSRSGNLAARALSIRFHGA